MKPKLRFGGHARNILPIVLWLAATAAPASAQVRETKQLTLQGADAIVGGAQRAATSKGARVVICVVDAAGIPIVLRRLDGTQVASVNVAIDKARTAAIYRRPSKDFEDQVSRGRVGAMALHGAVPLQGGVPIVVEGQVVGAIGVSGETPAIDEGIAIAGAKVAKSFKTQP
jgi:glc operon protein GlcG